MLRVVPLLFLANLCSSLPKIRDNRTFKMGTIDESSSSAAKDPPGTLKLMTFNTWLLGAQVNDGLNKIAKHILIVDPDIVGIQEVVNNTKFYELASKLGPQWQYAYINGSNSGILTKHQVITNETYTVQAGLGTTILINKQIPVHCFSLHLAYKAYGPYAANNKLVKDSKVFDMGEYFPAYSRVNNIRNLTNDKTFQKWLKLTTSVPLIIFGDFNTPSHLDWTEATKEQHGGWSYKWPATHLLQTKTKLIDTFREVYPDPAKEPGITWSTVWQNQGPEWNYTIPEPHDRIDFIYYRSQQLRTIDSQTYAGSFKPFPYNVKENDWPSDHYAVVSKLEWIDRKLDSDEKIDDQE